MKIPQKLEPYQRSRHRATLHAWVVAATAVASVGMPARALSPSSEDLLPGVVQDRQAEVDHAQRVAADWLEAVRKGDRHAALTVMRLPREAEHEHAVLDEVSALSDWLSHSAAEPEPVAHRRSGHWALSAWRLDGSGATRDDAGLIEPITLYNPVADGLSDTPLAWEVVPQGFETDAALSPLYNADYRSLMDWYDTLA